MAADDDGGGGTPSLAARCLRMSAGRRLMACTSASISATPGVAPAGAVPVALPGVSSPPAGAPPVLRGVVRELERVAGHAVRADDGVLPGEGLARPRFAVRPTMAYARSGSTRAGLANSGQVVKEP